MTNAETNKLIGKEGIMVIEKAGLRSPGLSINVIITDVRQSFGRVDILCVPVSGTGEKWTNLNKITLK
jgi:hypothetical protein